MASKDGNVFDMQIKLLTIGDSGVGKTCLLLRYTNDSFSAVAIYTIGIDFKVKNITVEGKKIKLQVRLCRSARSAVCSNSTLFVGHRFGILQDKKDFER